MAMVKMSMARKLQLKYTGNSLLPKDCNHFRSVKELPTATVASGVTNQKSPCAHKGMIQQNCENKLLRLQVSL